MIEKILLILDKTLANAISLLALTPNMTVTEQELVNAFITEVLDNTSLLEIKEKDAINYMKLYLKTRKEATTGLEELINDTQRERLEGLG